MQTPLFHTTKHDEMSDRRRAHQEWLLDEAIKETFPASDPVSPYVDDSASTIAATPHRQRRVPRRFNARQAPLPLAIVTGCLVLAGIVYLARRWSR